MLPLNTGMRRSHGGGAATDRDRLAPANCPVPAAAGAENTRPPVLRKTAIATPYMVTGSTSPVFAPERHHGRTEREHGHRRTYRLRHHRQGTGFDAATPRRLREDAGVDIHDLNPAPPSSWTAGCLLRMRPPPTEAIATTVATQVEGREGRSDRGRLKSVINGGGATPQAGETGCGCGSTAAGEIAAGSPR